MPLPPQEIREAAAEAVHRAVCAVTRGDGYGHCDLYATAGHVLLPAITGLDFMPQVGSFAARVDPPGGWFQIYAGDGGMARGEYHAWLGLPGDDTGRRDHGVRLYSAGQVVDFSLRHLRAMVERLPQIVRVVDQRPESILMELAPARDRIRYTRDDAFPPSLWVEGAPDGDLIYSPDVGAMSEFIVRNQRRPRLVADLRDEVLGHYASLASERGIKGP